MKNFRYGKNLVSLYHTYKYKYSIYFCDMDFILVYWIFDLSLWTSNACIMSEVHLYIIVTLLSDQIVIISELFFFQLKLEWNQKMSTQGWVGQRHRSIQNRLFLLLCEIHWVQKSAAKKSKLYRICNHVSMFTCWITSILWRHLFCYIYLNSSNEIILTTEPLVDWRGNVYILIKPRVPKSFLGMW